MLRLNKLQQRALLEADRAQQLVGASVEAVKLEMVELEAQCNLLRQELSEKSVQVETLKRQISDLVKMSNDSYQKTLAAVVESLGEIPQGEHYTKIIYEYNMPIGIDFLPVNGEEPCQSG